MSSIKAFLNLTKHPFNCAGLRVQKLLSALAPANLEKAISSNPATNKVLGKEGRTKNLATNRGA